MAQRAHSVAVALALLATPCLSHAQAVGEASVVDGSGRPIALAQATVSAGGRSLEMFTDEQGHLQLDPTLWRAGEVRLTISSVGYADLVVILSGPDDAKRRFTLVKQQADAGEIVVIARQISRPFSPKTIGFLDIATNPTAKGDPILAVNSLPVSTNVLGNARLTLRGNRASINRTYLDETPMYEFATGSEFDNTTQGKSIFNLAVGSNVEVYPVNPPSYLAGASGGAVRLIPPASATKGGILSLSTVGVNASQTIADEDGGNFATIYGGLTDLALHKAINPSLDALIDRVRSASGGVLARKTLSGGGELTGFMQAETSSDVFPFAIGTSRNLYTLEPTKARLALGLTEPVGDWVLEARLAYTNSHTEESFSTWFASSTNRYGFGSLDLVGRPFTERLAVRVGVDGELIDQASFNNSVAFGSFIAPAGAVREQDNRLNTADVFAFATYRVSHEFDLSVGSRQILLSNNRTGSSVQASGAFTSADRHSKLIVSLGRYAGYAVPSQAYFGPIERSVSRQIEVNYSLNWHAISGGVAGYLTSESSDGQAYDLDGGTVFTDNLTGFARKTKTAGVEVYANASFLNRWKAGFSYVFVHQKVDLSGSSVRGANDFPAIIRANVGYVAPPKTSIDLSWTWRSGEPFTEVVGLTSPDGRLSPIYGPIDGQRRPPYFTIDASASRQISLPGLRTKPLLFVSLTNLLGRANASSQLLTIPFRREAYRSLPRRVLALGLVFTY